MSMMRAPRMTPGSNNHAPHRSSAISVHARVRRSANHGSRTSGTSLIATARDQSRAGGAGWGGRAGWAGREGEAKARGADRTGWSCAPADAPGPRDPPDPHDARDPPNPPAPADA